MGILRSLTLSAFIVVAAVPVAHAQQYTVEEQSAQLADSGFSQGELDQILAPVALYPDELLSQVLMAATYPLEVVQAARWSRANPGLQGDEAVQAVDEEDWDPSVKSLVAFPNVLESMDQNLDWTQRLGEAFLANQDAVMASVQRLRRAAMEQGNLSSTDEMVVTRDGTDIAIDSPSPDTMYVPYYDPRVVYGNWWWPAYPPVYWAPWPGYYVGSYGFGWSVGIPIGVDFFFADFDWRAHRVHVDHRPFYFHDRNHRPIHVRNGEWRWDPHHRRDVPIRNPIARQEFGNARAPREVHRPTQQGPRPPAPQRPGQGTVAPRTPAPAQQQGTPIARPPQPRGFFPQQKPAVKPAPAPQTTAPQPAARQPVDRLFSRQQFGHPQAQPAPQPQALPKPQAPSPSAVARPVPSNPVGRSAPAHEPAGKGQPGGGNEGQHEGGRER